MVSLLTLVKATHSQKSAVVAAVEVDFLRLVVCLKRVEPHFHRLAAELGIDGEVPIINRDIGVNVIDGPRFAAEEELRHTLQSHGSLKPRALPVTRRG